MSLRRKAREMALQALYAWEIRSETAPGEMLDDLHQNTNSRVPDETLGFARALVDGVQAEQAVIDERLRAVSQSWSLERMGALERTILRLAVWELLPGGDVPREVAINEALELTRRYVGEEGVSFVNGILSAVAAEAAPRCTSA